jgi:hypothetical protein
MSLKNHTILHWSSEYFSGSWLLVFGLVREPVRSCASLLRHLFRLGATVSWGGDVLLGNFTFCPMPRTADNFHVVLTYVQYRYSSLYGITECDALITETFGGNVRTEL